MTKRYSLIKNMEGKIYLHALNSIEGLGPASILKLVKFFGSAEEIWRAARDNAKLPELFNFNCRAWQTLRSEVKHLNPEDLFQKIPKEVQVIAFNDKQYSPLLREIYAPPPVIYCRGNTELLKNRKVIAVVGTRKTSSYGTRACESTVKELASSDITIVSGMAIGIDAIAHKACLECEGNTIAVLGGGIDDKNIHPRGNLRLAEEIIEKGLLVSEFPPETEPHRANFPRRNRTISGLSKGTLVVEAPKDSGALITAEFAVEQNREVFAVPGNLDQKTSEGTNKLIKEGANLAECARDVMEVFGWKYFDSKLRTQNSKLNDDEREILSSLEERSATIDELTEATGLDIKKLTSKLTAMELKKIVERGADGKYFLI